MMVCHSVCHRVNVSPIGKYHVIYHNKYTTYIINLSTGRALQALFNSSPPMGVYLCLTSTVQHIIVISLNEC